MTAKELYERIKPIQQARGYRFNKDEEHVMALMGGLLRNRDRYGYMACPCRLAADDREWDQDILCPCIYREPDIQEYGSCYCGLYVSEDWNEGKIPQQYVPERRPVEKVLGKL